MAVLASEEALLLAIEYQLIDSGYFESHEVGIEYDEMAPNLVGQRYVAISPNVHTVGEDNGGGAVIDRYLSVDIHVIVRVQEVPKDRLKKQFYVNSKALNTLCSQVEDVIDFKWEVCTRAGVELQTLESSTTAAQGFVEPLKFRSRLNPVAISSSFFSGTRAEAVTGLSRTIQFEKARRIVSRL